MKGKLENDPNLTQQKKILDHHPHMAFPQHGKVMTKKPHLLAKIRKPGRSRAEY